MSARACKQELWDAYTLALGFGEAVEYSRTSNKALFDYARVLRDALDRFISQENRTATK